MSDEWNWGQDPKKTDDTPRQSDSDVSAQAASDQQTAPEEDLNENVTYHYKYTRSREAGGNAADSDNGNYYASHNYGEMNLAAVPEALPVNKVQNLNMHITR